MIYAEMNISGHKLSRGAEPTLPVSVSYIQTLTLLDLLLTLLSTVGSLSMHVTLIPKSFGVEFCQEK